LPFGGEHLMKKFVCVAAALCASTAFANLNVAPIDRTNTPIFSDGNGVEITATPIDEFVGSAAISGGTIYSNLDAGGGYFSVSGTAGPVSFDYYNTNVTGETDPLIGQSGLGMDEFTFIGGVDAVGGILFFDFFDVTGTTNVDGFGISLPQAGNFIWSINITNDDVFINDEGLVQMTADDGTFGGGIPTTGVFFLSDANPTIGTWDAAQSAGFTGGPFDAPLSHKFEIVYTPEPTSLVLLGLAGLLIRRR
jgi:hypothetical protein